METKLCRKCGRILSVSEFHGDAQKYDGYSWHCKDCMRKEKAHRDYIRTESTRLGRNPKLWNFSTEELLKEVNTRIANAYK